ncbi:hypothetical protein [Chondromyces crocatus]|uniref:Secreted protein n=1 Tax=Chondromyces crocatus TaxID=52 RepID=A0A0K1EEP1_CHOCO|nr:hypothetical protein [Chondromyces crocatus]AKT39043.1 uncharacterized protein CMC5_031890 [Chondromyces crocatus]
MKLLIAPAVLAASLFTTAAFATAPAPAPASAPAPAPAPATTSRSDGWPHAELSAIPLFAFGVLPGPSLGVAPYVGFRWPEVSFALEARTLFSIDREAVLARHPIDAGIVMAVPTVCGHRGRWFLCTSLGIGELRARGDGRVVVETQDPWLVSVGLRTGIDVTLARRLVLRGIAEVAWLAGQPEVWIDQKRQWEMEPIGLVFGLGLIVPVGGTLPRR